MTTRSRRFIDTTRPGPISPAPQARWKHFMRNERGENTMETLELELEQVATPTETAQTDRERKSKPRGKSKGRLLIAGGLVVLVAVGTATYFHFAGRVSTDDAQVDAHIAPIAPRISGSVAEILVDDNQAVKAGQVLLRIDPRDYQAKVDQAHAALAAAQSQAV